jgi:hypothetical protein
MNLIALYDSGPIYGTVKRKNRRTSEQARIRSCRKKGRHPPGLLSMWAEAWAQGCEELRALQRLGVRWDTSGRITVWPARWRGRVGRMQISEAATALADLRDGLPGAMLDISPGTCGKAALRALGLEGGVK